MENLNKDESDPVRLLRTPPPFIDECLMGYILRLTQENGYGTPSWIFELTGLKVSLARGGHPALYRMHCDLAAFQQITCLTSSECEKINYQLSAVNNSVRIAAHHLPINFIRFNSPKICPECLQQNEYCRIIWDLLPFTACPFHKRILLDKCPQCNKRLSWVRNRVSVCRCGFDWRSAVATDASLSELKLSRQIVKLFCRPVSKDSVINENNPIYGLEVSDLFRSLSFVADWYLFALTGQRLSAKIENELCHQAYAHTLNAFEDWPNNFYIFLDHVKRLSGKEIRNSKFYRRADEMCEGRSLRFILIALEDYVEEYELSAISDGLMQLTPLRTFLTKSDACRSLCIEPNWLELLIEQGKLEVTQRWGESEELICGGSIMHLKDNLSYLLSVRAVAKVLSIVPADVEDLIHHGCLVAESGPDVDGLPDWRFSEENLYPFIKAISDRIVISDSEMPKDLIAATEVLGRLRRRNVGAGRFTSDILNRNIVPVADIHSPGFAGLLFRTTDVDEYLKSFGEEHYGEECRPNYVAKYKLWTKALIAVKETNVRSCASRTVVWKDEVNASWISLNDLPRVAYRVFGQAV